MEPALFLNGSPVRSEAPQKNRILPECRAEDVASDTEAQGRGYMKRVWGVGQEISGWAWVRINGRGGEGSMTQRRADLHLGVVSSLRGISFLERPLS